MVVFNPDGGSVPGPVPALSIVSVGPANDADLDQCVERVHVASEDVLSSSDGWVTVTNPPVVNGDQYAVMIEAHSGSEFYRLVPSLTFQPGETNKTVRIQVDGRRFERIQ
jgi:hypothetical protein